MHPEYYGVLPMNYRLLADAVLVVHAVFVVFVMAGGLLVLRWPRFAWIHLPAVAWGAGIELLGRICPLTPLENHWRRLAGQQGYGTDFIEHYVVSALYPDGLTRRAQIGLGLLVLATNAVVYAVAWRRNKASRP